MNLTTFSFDIDGDGIAHAVFDVPGRSMNTLTAQAGADIVSVHAEHNASPHLDLELSGRTEARLRRKHADDFALWQGIADGGVYIPLPARPRSAAP